MACYITHTSAFLPGQPIANTDMERYMGSIEGEAEVKTKVLAMNQIVSRHYAQDHTQQATHDVYELGAVAVRQCLATVDRECMPSYLAAGTTFTPLAAPGYASILHDRLRQTLERPLEISSHTGVCTSSMNAMVAAIRAIEAGHHKTAVCAGADHSSEILKATAICPIDDRAQHDNIRDSRWFMSVFLRFMLSDGAGACLLQDRPATSGLSLKVNWTHSRSFAHETPLCMQLDSRSALLSQDLNVLSRYLFPTGGKFLSDAMATHGDSLDAHKIILPHMSSYFFRRKLERIIAANCGDPNAPVPYWTNLATAGNTGAASSYIMLDHYLRRNELRNGDRVLLFVPESGQFNFVLVSLTAVLP
jgi:3-oxoacyl-[acyl-carrier-protein] synthase III